MPLQSRERSESHPFKTIPPQVELDRLTSDEQVQITPAVTTFPAQPLSDFTVALMWGSFIGFTAYAMAASGRSQKQLTDMSLSFSVTLLTNIQAFCEDEICHLTCCLGIEDHEPPLAYWYRLYVVIAESARLPLFYGLLQRELALQIQDQMYAEDENLKNFMVLMTGYVLLHGLSRLYSELINPRILVPETQCNLFFRKPTALPPLPNEPFPAPSPSPEHRLGPKGGRLHDIMNHGLRGGW